MNKEVAQATTMYTFINGNQEDGTEMVLEK
jgi:hypothetical protein